MKTSQDVVEKSLLLRSLCGSMSTRAALNPVQPIARGVAADGPAPVAAFLGPERPARLLGAADVAQVLGVPETFVYALARRGDLPTVRVGERYVRFRPEALLAWIEQRESTRPKGSR